jgi:ABC-type antimicrobial peptide transport system permease subunit
VIGRTVGARYIREEVVLEIVGLAGDVRHRELREGFVPMIYHPAEGRLRTGVLLIRSSLPQAEVMAIARDIVHEIDPVLPISEVSTLREDVAQAMGQERMLARIGFVVAGLAGLLAVAGLYAVIASFVQERVREFAIHMALGASGPNVAGRIIRRVLGVVALGLVVGFGLVALTSRLLASRLYGVGPLDPATIGAAALLLTTAGLLAAWLPARRATRIDPMVSLRLE